MRASKPLARDRDRKGILCVVAAGFDTLVTENALAVVAHVKLVIDFDGRRDGGGLRAVGGCVNSRERRIASLSDGDCAGPIKRSGFVRCILRHEGLN